LLGVEPELEPLGVAPGARERAACTIAAPRDGIGTLPLICQPPAVLAGQAGGLN